MDFPMWVKPVRSMSSDLAFHVNDRRQFEEAVAEIGTSIDKVDKPFALVLEHVDLPQEVAEAGGRACLAKEEVTGRQLTVEGHNYDGRPHVHGISDSHTYPDSSSFLRFQYPSAVPSSVAEHLVDVSKRVIPQLGLGYGTFHIEYFWDPDKDEINLLEVSPRHSQSHVMVCQGAGWSSRRSPTRPTTRRRRRHLHSLTRMELRTWCSSARSESSKPWMACLAAQ